MRKAERELPDSTAHIFWATVDYHRLWLPVDQVERWRLARYGVGLSASSIRRIGLAYYFNRGIRQLKDDEGARQLADKLNNTSWPEGVADRCDCCLRLAHWASATMANGKTITKGQQGSAMSKLMWFLHPNGWTVFDRFVAKAVGIPAYRPRPDQARRYYRILDERGFRSCTADARACVDTTSFPDLYPERVLDRYLMIRGGVYSGHLSELPLVLEGYLRGLGTHASDALVEMATRLQQSLGPDPMNVYESTA
jgi:hypothetical protein